MFSDVLLCGKFSAIMANYNGAQLMQTFPFFSYSILFEFLAVSLPWAKIDLVSLKLETEHVRCIN